MNGFAQKLLNRPCERPPAASRLSPFVRGTMALLGFIVPPLQRGTMALWGFIVPLAKGDAREAAGGRSHDRSNSFRHSFTPSIDRRYSYSPNTLAQRSPGVQSVRRT